MKYQTIPFLAITTSLIFLSACASYNATSLNTLASDGVFSTAPEGEKQDIVIVAKAFNRTDCKRYLDRDVLAKGYQPVQVYIENNSDKDYIFSLNRVSLSCARPEEVAEKVHTSTVGRALGYGVGSLFLWPLAIPAVIDGMKSYEANEALDSDFSSKVAKDQIILPHSHFNKLLLVPREEFQPKFYITLIEKESHQPKKIEVVSRG